MVLEHQFRVSIVPKGARHFKSILSEVHKYKDSTMFNFVLGRAFWHKIVYHIPYTLHDPEITKSVNVIRRLRFNYAMSYWY